MTNWDTEFLERKIRATVLSTKYEGTLEVTFPITNSRVVIAKQSPNTSSSTRERSDGSGKRKWLGRSRPPATVAGQTTAASSNDPIQDCHPIQAIWPYASSSPAVASPSQSNPPFSTRAVPQYAVQSEQDWWNVWTEPIRNGVLAKKRGWVTVEDWRDVVLGHVRCPELKKSWGTSIDDSKTFVKGLKSAGSHRTAPGGFVKGMRYANSLGL